MFDQILTLLWTIALPVLLVAVVDDWWFRPRRQLAALPEAAADPGWVSALHFLVPVVIIGSALHLIRSETLDFSLVLVLVVAVSAVVWALDRWWLAPRRAQAAALRGQQAAAVPLPTTVDYARSFLPVAIIVLVIRSFIFEPFRIPSDSMMPTLLDGDFIVVNKYAYGLRLPVLNRKVMEVGQPQRGDVVVFRYPKDPRQNYIKRLVGLPGDRVQVLNDQLIVNGQPVPQQQTGTFDDGCYHNLRLLSETLGQHTHQVMACRSMDALERADVAGSCSRAAEHWHVCVESGSVGSPGQPDSGDFAEHVVPAGHYLMIGDNRDNSADSRFWGESADGFFLGYVPEENLVGKATRIWFNWDWGRSGGPTWRRIGRKID